MEMRKEKLQREEDGEVRMVHPRLTVHDERPGEVRKPEEWANWASWRDLMLRNVSL